ncbi:RNase adapter RapZ [Propionibacterium sp.]|uniref:RNase adapter RapZ n=1 Tax=Propionibacterium sp. TaxID=1977903 RepID=UPI0039ED9678
MPSPSIRLPRRPRTVIITGMSGAGRRTCAHAMEDLGWFVVDNLPPSLLPQLIETASTSGLNRLAVGLDVRSRDMFEQLPVVFAQLDARDVAPEILFLEASDEAIVRRQESSRRPLPLQGDGRLLDGIVRERRMLSDLRASADMVIDTSRLNVHQLSSRIAHAYGGQSADTLRVQVMSFGYKNGLPLDADLVFDVRFLPNPHWVPELRPQTGLSEAVSSYVLAQPGAEEFLDAFEQLFAVAEPGYLREGKRQVTVAIGCTGGKHRSTAMSEAAAQRLRARGMQVNVLHRDLGLE